MTSLARGALAATALTPCTPAAPSPTPTAAATSAGPAATLDSRPLDVARSVGAVDVEALLLSYGAE